MGNSPKLGVTLVEVLLVIAILLILAVIMVGTIDPIELVGRSVDARKKKDIGRIRVAFEEYQSDKGCYPTQTIIDELSEQSNCGSSVFEPWLNDWPCGSNNEPYIILIDPVNLDCPGWFRVLVNLENQNDPMIPDGWYQRGSTYHVGPYGINDVNYGTSSTNINWDDFYLDPSCRWYADRHNFDDCYTRSVGGGCAGATNNACSGDNCYARSDCHLTEICKVSCCGSACN